MMKNVSFSFFIFFLLIIFVGCSFQNKRKASHWNAEWIQSSDITDTINSWTIFRKELNIINLPNDSILARIAVDSKYWLWINGQMVVREGGLKRGPSPTNTYYDKVAIERYFQEGKNVIALLVQYFGKEGFSHKSSGSSGLIFDYKGKQMSISSDSTWKAWPHKAYGETEPPYPNYRLPESNIFYNANHGNEDFIASSFDDSKYPNAVSIGKPPVNPWNKLVERPVPMWKDYGLKPYVNQPVLPFIAIGDTIKLNLPYNAQVNPYMKIYSPDGNDTINIRTDHYFGGGAPNLRGVYITRKGIQEFELPSWINGEVVFYHIPEKVKVIDLKYRETGYETQFSGSFHTNDHFFNKLWQKSLRTLYVTMRDTYMDCPDRERAQWWGDVVLESGEAFYALDRKSDLLTKKGMMELINWQAPGGKLFSPVPAGNWNKELPGQMLSSIGFYGFYNYFLNTNDKQTIKKVYPSIKKYLSLWRLKGDETIEIRQGDWLWGDWGENKDIPIIINTQYYLALKAMRLYALSLGIHDDASYFQTKMEKFKDAFNKKYWKGTCYKSDDYIGLVDDRSQALAVVSGLADPDKYVYIFNVLSTQMHASPYMEKYVIEALFQMGYDIFALQRLKKRYAKMVNHPTISTMWEGWGIGEEGYGGGTTNHAWSGGGLTLLSQYVAGISPIDPGYTKFSVRPQIGSLYHVKATVPSIKGDINVEVTKNESYTIRLDVPSQTTAEVRIPKENFEYLSVNNKNKVKPKVIKSFNKNSYANYYFLELTSGKYTIKAYK